MTNYSTKWFNESELTSCLWDIWRKVLNNFWEKVLAKMDEKTPTKSGLLKRNNKLKKAIGNETEVKIENDTSYALPVETGVKWQTFNYHRWPPTDASTVFKTWVWAWFASEAFDETLTTDFCK